MPTLVLLPGMDGTGTLFGPFVRAVAGAVPTQVVAYPTSESLGWGALADRVTLPGGPFVLVAESFSGPIALRIAAKRPVGLVGVVLVASFVERPAWTPVALDMAVGTWFFRVPPPRWALRRYLVGPDAPDELVEATRAAIVSVRPEVLAARLSAILQVDAVADLRAVDVPILHLAATKDAIVAPSAAKRIREIRPDAVAVDLEAPHLVLQRAPEAAWAAIRSWCG
jgi:pimeloyl-[acyl-carrier protein] methyl ester esterase